MTRWLDGDELLMREVESLEVERPQRFHGPYSSDDHDLKSFYWGPAWRRRQFGSLSEWRSRKQ